MREFEWAGEQGSTIVQLPPVGEMSAPGYVTPNKYAFTIIGAKNVRIVGKAAKGQPPSATHRDFPDFSGFVRRIDDTNPNNITFEGVTADGKHIRGGIVLNSDGEGRIGQGTISVRQNPSDYAPLMTVRGALDVPLSGAEIGAQSNTQFSATRAIEDGEETI